VLTCAQSEAATYASPLKLTAVDEGDELGEEPNTPATTTRPSPQDMHPARYQSTVKKQPTEQCFGTVVAADFPAIPTTIVAGAMLPPSSPVAKLTAKRQSFAAPDFEFKFRQSTDMSSEAQRMMDEVREQAAKIKGDLAIHREVQERKDDEIDAHYGRKIATPKAKSSRYSGVHKDEFQKMNSIANHSSTFRASVAQPAAPPAMSPAKTTKVPLRPEAAAVVPPAKLPGSTLKRTASSKSLNGKEDDMTSPAKRRRTGVAGLVGRFEHAPQQDSARVVTNSRPGTPSATSSTSGATRIIPGSATTTKPALGRFETVKNQNSTTSTLSTVAPSPAVPKPFSTPAATRIAAPLTSGKKARTSFVQRLANMSPVKSILRRPQPNYSNDPHKLAAGTHISTPKSTTKTVTDNNISSLLPDLQGTPPPRPSNRKEKHVAFPTVKDEQRATQLTPSPAKPTNTIVYPMLNLEQSTPSAVQPSPTRLLVPHMNSAKARASVAGTADFTFRSAQRLDFSPERSKAALLNANTARTSTPTIRHVRASDVTPYLLNGTASASAKKLADLPTVPHGLSNKKRKRTRSSLEKDKLVFGNAGDVAVNPTSSNGGSDKENTEVVGAAAVQEGSPTKRMKMSIPRPASAGGPVAGGASGSVGASAARARLLAASGRGGAASGRGGAASKIPKRNGAGAAAKGRSVLSLSRLQALSKPKERT